MKRIFALTLVLLIFCLVSASCAHVTISIKDDGSLSANVNLGVGLPQNNNNAQIPEDDYNHNSGDIPSNEDNFEDPNNNFVHNFDGIPYIGPNGNWWKNGVDSGIKAESDYVSACEHESYSLVTMFEHTPDFAGTSLRVCNNCNYSEIIQGKHDYSTTEIVDPTCTEQGYTKHICQCGGFTTDSYLPPIDHEFHGAFGYIDKNLDIVVGLEVFECVNCHSEELLYVTDVNEFVASDHACDYAAPDISQCLHREGSLAVYYIFNCPECEKWVLAYFE